MQVVQEIKVMRTGVTAREKERAERATLVQQEKLSKAKVPFSSLLLSPTCPGSMLQHLHTSMRQYRPTRHAGVLERRHIKLLLLS